MNRRTLIQAASGLILAAGAGQLWTPETEGRRYWQLDRGMLGRDWAQFTLDAVVVDGVRYPVQIQAFTLLSSDSTRRT